MAISVTCSTIITTPEGKWYVRFADGSELEFNDLEQMQEMGANLETVDTAQVLFIRWWLARSPSGTNTALIVGKKLTLNLGAAAPIKVQ